MSILTRKIGPLPGWAWGGLIAVGVWWFFLRGKNAAAPGGASGTSPSGQATTDYSLGFAQGLQAGTPAPTAPPSGQATTGAQTVTIRERSSSGPFANYDQISAGVPVYLRPGAGQIGVVPYGSTQKLAQVGPAPGSGSQILTQGGQPAQGPSNGFSSQYWAIVFGPVTGWVGANDVAGAGQAQTGVGGARGGRKHGIGSRSAAPIWHDAHPLIGARVPYAHYVRAVGGPANHRREVARVAQQAGVHPARIAMLNPEHTGRIRIA